MVFVLLTQAACAVKTTNQDQTTQLQAREFQRNHSEEMVSNCPFGFVSGNEGLGQDAQSDFQKRVQNRKNEVITLYEEYVHLDGLRGKSMIRDKSC